MDVHTVPIDAIHADPSNVRLHPEKNLSAIRASLARFGQQRPILVDGNGIVRAGNGTLEAARSLGWTEINVVYTELENTEATAYAIADNRTADLAEWDEASLAKTLRSLQDEDFNLAAVGFTDAEVEDLFEKLASQKANDYMDQLADSRNGDVPHPGSVPDGYKSFVVVFTQSQDVQIRQAIAMAKGLHSLETTPEALHTIAAHYLATQGKS